MKFRQKLLVLLVPTLIAAITVGILILDNEAKKLVRGQAASKVLSIAATTAAAIDAEMLKDVIKEGSEDSQAYKKLRKTLHRAVQANRRKDIFLRQLFVIYSSPQKNSVLLIAVNPSEDPALKTHMGDVYHPRLDEPVDLSKPFVPAQILHDEWGNWSSGFAPILDGSGMVVGAVVAEMPAVGLKNRLGLLKTYSIVAVFLATLFGAVLAWLIAKWATTPLHELHHAITQLGSGDMKVRVKVDRKDEFGQVGGAFNEMMEGLQERDSVKKAFARYVSQQLLDRVLQSKEAPILSGDRRKVTVLFADIRGFTTLSEKLSPEQVVGVLNAYFARMVDIIFRNHGTLDKFIGDGIMAIFGAPIDDPHQEEHAIQAALEMQGALSSLNQECGLPNAAFRIGIGINTGIAIVGNIGSTQRMDYTAVGDTVNVASRLESATKEYDVDILISDYTYTAVRGNFPAQRIGEISVKGRTEPITVHGIRAESRQSPATAAAL